MHGPRVSIDANSAVARPAYPGAPGTSSRRVPRLNWWKVAFIAAAGTAALWYVTRKTEIPPMPVGAINEDGSEPQG